MTSNHRAEEENDNLVVNSIRKFFDELETNRIPEDDQSFPMMDFHDYYLEDGEVETWIQIGTSEYYVSSDAL